MKFIPKYDNFIELLRRQEYGPEIPLENHHITPKFEINYGVSENIIYNMNNIVRISSRHHTLAHYVRYKTFRKLGDKVAYLMRSGQTDQAVIERKKLIVEINRTRGNTFWSSDWQRLQGLKGGAKGGLANTENQFLARQQVGLKYGRMVGISNQSQSSRKFLLESTIWQYKHGVLTVEVPVYESFQGVVRHINACVDENNKFRDKDNQIRTITNSSSFAKVRDGERKQLYGWSLLRVDKEIRSEADYG